MLGAAVLVAVAGGVLIWWASSSRITEESCNRIEIGMKRSDVERLFGGRPVSENRDSAGRVRVLAYWGNEGEIEVFFDAQGAVWGRRWLPVYRDPWQRVLEWLGLRKR